MKKKFQLSDKNIEENKNRAKRIINQAKKFEKQGCKVIVSDSKANIISVIEQDGYLSSFYDDANVKMIEISASRKELFYSAIKKYDNSFFYSQSSNNNNSSSTSQSNSTSSSTVQSNNNSNSSSTSQSNSTSSSTSQSSNNSNSSSTVQTMTEEERKEYTQKAILENKQSQIRTEVRCNLNPYNQFNTLYFTMTTSEEYQTTDIKAFRKMLDEYFKSLSKELKKVTVKHKNDNVTYTYENFSIISVISCTERGYLHCHCLLIFESVITKIAPKTLENGAIGFNFENNIFKNNWTYGNVHIQHYLNGLSQDDINRTADYFAKNYKEIREIKNIKDEDMMYQAENRIDNYLEKLSKTVTTTELYNMIECKDMLIEECYNNLLELREQQGENKRNKIYYSEKIVLEEDLTVSDMTYKNAEKYVDNMTVTEQTIKFRWIAMLDENQQVVYRLQISLKEVYENEKRTYSNSLNIFSKEERCRIQRMRRNPVAVVEQEQEQQRCNCVYYDEEYKEELCYLYSDEEDMLIYEELLSGMVLA